MAMVGSWLEAKPRVKSDVERVATSKSATGKLWQASKHEHAAALKL